MTMKKIPFKVCYRERSAGSEVNCVIKASEA
jgi:hypothetical protein